MKYKIVLVIIIIINTLVLVGCNNNYKQNNTEEKDETILYVTQFCITGYYWEYECEPDDYIQLIEKGYESKTIINMLSPALTEYWKFKTIKQGEFTLYFLKYHIGDWLIADESYAEDYIVDENLEIHFEGKRPIYEYEKYDRILFEQFVNQIEQNFDRSFEPENLGGITYSITSSYMEKSIDITVKNNNYDENLLIEFTENKMDYYLKSFGPTETEYNYSITIE
jgi:hypothetical protein